jgi:hypothetical protein
MVSDCSHEGGCQESIAKDNSFDLPQVVLVVLRSVDIAIGVAQ